jgi:type I restriction enzyme M protein
MISHVSETRAEEVARELLAIRGWSTVRPPKGNVLWKNEYKSYPHIVEALAGRGKLGKGGDGYPDFLVLNQQSNRVMIVGETKAKSSEINKAAEEADFYADAFSDIGNPVLAAGIAGDETSNIAVRVNKRGGRGWRPIVYGSDPIQWLPTPDEADRLIEDDTLFDLQPRVPSSEVLARRGDQINRVLRECKIKDQFARL